MKRGNFLKDEKSKEKRYKDPRKNKINGVLDMYNNQNRSDNELDQSYYKKTGRDKSKDTRDNYIATSKEEIRSPNVEDFGFDINDGHAPRTHKLFENVVISNPTQINANINVNANINAPFKPKGGKKVTKKLGHGQTQTGSTV